MGLIALHDIFTGLAEGLATPNQVGLPAWIAAPGREWPLFEPAVRMAVENPSDAWIKAVTALDQAASDSLGSRRESYENLFIGRGSPPIWLYESMHRDGRFPGPSSFSVGAIYKKAGLDVVGAELADHASNELAFLAYLVQQEIDDVIEAETWARVRKLFIKNHAGRWLPEVGRKLNRSPYPVWTAMGYLLIASLLPKSAKPRSLSANNGIPIMQAAAKCDLCGFCVQVCPTKALAIKEDKLSTELWLKPEICIHCAKCEKICHAEVLAMGEEEKVTQPVLLKESPRAICPQCSEPTVSQAELDSVAERLGHRPVWLDYCVSCR